MARFESHPTVLAVKQQAAAPPPARLSSADLRQLCLDAGADDAGSVSLDRTELDDQRAEILAAFPHARTLLSIVCRMNRDPIRSPARSVANLEFHHTTDQANEVAREVVRRLEDRGVRALNPPSGFPMEMSRFPGKSGLCRTNRSPSPPVWGTWAFTAT